jgi:signal transduction histidine kinase
MVLASTPEIAVLSLNVDGKEVRLTDEQPVRLSPFADSIDLRYGPIQHPGQLPEPVRIRFKLEGVDTAWRELAGPANLMRLSIRFLDQNGNEVMHKDFEARGQSPGWTGSLETSPLQTRREQIVVPLEASSLWVVITSAGAPGVVGTYFVRNLTVQVQNATNRPASDLLNMRFNPSNQSPVGWLRDGPRANMAQIISIAPGEKSKGLAIVDDSPVGHAQWNTLRGEGPKVSPLDVLVVAWDEMFSIALATPATVTYKDLRPGFYRFSLNRLSLMGVPSNDEVSLGVVVLSPFWKTAWFWTSTAFAAVGMAFAIWRYHEARQLQLENVRLSQRQVVEAERLRIARDIHDDLGAGVTEISLFSSEAQKKPGLSPETVTDFDTVSRMSRNLVRSLYETVWAVSPENDHLDSLATYICQMADHMCGPAGLRCRLQIPELPHEVRVTSSIRHNLVMVVKESIHNVIKHADATEVQISLQFSDGVLTIEVKDNGQGFDPSTSQRGRGLSNMEQRMKSLGGMWSRVSQVGSGTRIRLELQLQENGDSAHRDKEHA